MTPGPAAFAWAAMGGLVLGSFAVTAGLRLAHGEGLEGRSRCDGCRRTLGWRETVPLVSFVAARGACGRCAQPIPRLHPIGEAAGAAIALTSLLSAEPWRAALLVALGLMLLALAACDWGSRRLPDGLTAATAMLAAGLAWRAPGGVFVVHLLIAVVTAAVLLAVRAAAARRRGAPGLGLGDVKLLAALAIWLGPLTPWAVVVASAAGLAAMLWARPDDGRLPFGPFIALGAWAVGITGEAGLWPTTM